MVAYGHRSLDVMQIIEGARGWCDLVWLIDADDTSAARVRPILRKFGQVVEALGKSPAEAAAALRPHGSSGLATFYDSGMQHLAAIAHELGLPFHSEVTALRLEDKLHQREAFRAAGLPTPRLIDIPVDADRSTVQRLAGAIDYPAVLKPRRASGSWHTLRVDSAERLVAAWCQLAAEGSEELLAEEYLPDGPPMPGGFEADYVSVETVVTAGEMVHLAITGRFPLAPPFRETGFFIPATVIPENQEDVLALAGDALRALGVVSGAAHTEIKLTHDGPRVIEVNGRIGGGVPDMLRLAAGLDIVRLTMRSALSRPIEVDALPPTTCVAYRFFYQPPPAAHTLREISGLDRLKALPGVESVYLHHPPGSEINSYDGTRSYLFAVVGSATDYAGLVAIDQFLRTEIGAQYHFS